jgi:hypothetical protein
MDTFEVCIYMPHFMLLRGLTSFNNWEKNCKNEGKEGLYLSNLEFLSDFILSLMAS